MPMTGVLKCWTEAPDGPFRTLETVLAGARSTLPFVSKGIVVSNTMQRRSDVPVILVVYTVFASVATIFAVITMFNERLQSMTVPYTGWIGLSLYSFTIFFAVFGCFYLFPPAVNAVKSMLKYSIAIGAFDLLFYIVPYLFGAQDFDNPYLTYSAWRPFVTIGLPAFWVVLLAYDSSTSSFTSSPEISTKSGKSGHC